MRPLAGDALNWRRKDWVMDRHLKDVLFCGAVMLAAAVVPSLMWWLGWA